MPESLYNINKSIYLSLKKPFCDIKKNLNQINAITSCIFILTNCVKCMNFYIIKSNLRILFSMKQKQIYTVYECAREKMK